MKSSFFLITGVLFLISMNGCKKDVGSGGGTDQPSWKFLSPMPTERYSFGLVAYNHLFYAIGGYNTNGSNAVEVYDPANDKW
ncbi:MAG TPA: hypothetical protein VFV08_04850, partial [Puia sp.]|nr:hypothetical protein [Puia sp.]